MTHEIAQCDRDAAADLLLWRGVPRTEANAVRKGELDGHHVVKAFAAHRLAAIRATSEAAAKLAETLEFPWKVTPEHHVDTTDDFGQPVRERIPEQRTRTVVAGKHIATALRNGDHLSAGGRDG